MQCIESNKINAIFIDMLHKDNKTLLHDFILKALGIGLFM